MKNLCNNFNLFYQQDKESATRRPFEAARFARSEQAGNPLFVVRFTIMFLDKAL